jgi:hypothetical protein
LKNEKLFFFLSFFHVKDPTRKTKNFFYFIHLLFFLFLQMPSGNLKFCEKFDFFFVFRIGEQKIFEKKNK